MSSVEQFPTCLKGLEDVPMPFREALSKGVRQKEVIGLLLFSPVFHAGKFTNLASVLCLTDRRWLVVLMQDDGRITVDTASYETTLLLELTIILLYGQLKIDFVCHGQVRSTALQFNTVMKDSYCDALRDILDKMEDNVRPKVDGNPRATEILQQWPIKFRNVAVIYAPRSFRLLDGVQWNDIYGRFHRLLAPATALLLTDRHIIVIAEEKPSGWFQFRERSHYGEIITYLLLDRLVGFQLREHTRFAMLEIVGHQGHGNETLEIILPHDQGKAVRRLMKEASFRSRHGTS